LDWESNVNANEDENSVKEKSNLEALGATASEKFKKVTAQAKKATDSWWGQLSGRKSESVGSKAAAIELPPRRAMPAPSRSNFADSQTERETIEQIRELFANKGMPRD
jgi:hypothetical protein